MWFVPAGATGSSKKSWAIIARPSGSPISTVPKGTILPRTSGCLAHQLRDCQFAIEAGDTMFAPRMKAILLRDIAIHHRRDTLAASTLSQYRGDLQRRVDRCLACQPINPHGKRLHKRYAKIQDHLFLFLDDASIPPTNNASEQESH